MTNHVHLSLHRLKFLRYIFMAHCSHALSPSLYGSSPHTCVCVCVGRSRAFAELLWSKIPTFFLLHRLQAHRTSTPPIAKVFGKTCPSLMLLFQSPSSCQVDKVSSASDRSSWEQSEGNKYWMEASRWRRLKGINIYATEYITGAVYSKTQQLRCWTEKEGKDRTDQKQQRMKPFQVHTQR